MAHLLSDGISAAALLSTGAPGAVTDLSASDHPQPAPLGTSNGPITREQFVLAPFLESSDSLASWQMFNTLLPYGLLWWASLQLRASHPWLLPPLITLQVLFLARCFSLMHDCGHHSLFRNRLANRCCGFLLGVVSGIPQLPWSRGHEFHHRHNGNWEKYQGPSALITCDAYRDLSPNGQRLYRWLRHPLMLFPGGFFYLVIKPRVALLLGVADLIPHIIERLRREPELSLGTILAEHRSRHWHSPEQFRDLILNNLAVLLLWSGMAYWVGAWPFWSLYAPVMTCGAAIFICIFFVQHNFPGSYAHASDDWTAMAGTLEGTSDLELPALLNWFTADIGCHAMHHLCAAIPNYRLRACSLRNTDLLQSVKRLRLANIPSCFAYILWDPQRGTLTTPAALATAHLARGEGEGEPGRKIFTDKRTAG